MSYITSVPIIFLRNIKGSWGVSTPYIWPVPKKIVWEFEEGF